MFSQACKDGRLSRSVVASAVAAAMTIACAGQALAADRGGRSQNNMNKQVYGARWNGHGGHGGGGHHDDHSHSSFSLNIGIGSYGYGSGWSAGYGYSSGYGAGYGYGWRGSNWCGPTYYRPPVCAPVVVAPCPPPVVVAPYPPVIVRDSYYAPVTRTVVVSEPVVVERPVYVEKRVVVERPVTIEKKVIVEKVIERPAPAPEPAPAEPASPQTGNYRDRELGDAYLRIGDMTNAARVYGRYLAAWDKDGTATRNLGLAQIATGHPQEGFKNIVTGYKLEPSLLDRPLRMEDIGGASAHSALLDQAARSADGLNTADAWLTVAMLQHMGGQKYAAISALQKARDAGLDTATLDAFTLKMAG